MIDLQQVEILLVEDNPRDAEMTLRALRKHNFANQVHWVKDGDEALEFMFCEGAYAGRDPNRTLKLVLLDIKMPKVDGIEVLRQIKTDPQLHTVPVVMLTSSAEEPDLQRSYDLGVNAYVVKPVEFSEFISAVSRLGIFWGLVNTVPPPSRS